MYTEYTYCCPTIPPISAPRKPSGNKELRIPKDISLAGYDGIPLTQTLRPQLTTVRQKSEAMGEQAAKLLIARLEQPEAAVEAVVTVPVELIKGSTVGWCDVWYATADTYSKSCRFR